MNIDRQYSGHVEIQAVESVSGRYPDPATFGGSASIVNDVLLFGMTRLRCDGHLTCVITLYDDQNTAMSPSAQASWAPPDSQDPDPDMQYLQFSDFPRRADGGKLTICAYVVTLTYEIPQNQETEGRVHLTPTGEPYDPGMEISLIVYRG
jgi:hypothetical protein